MKIKLLFIVVILIIISSFIVSCKNSNLKVSSSKSLSVGFSDSNSKDISGNFRAMEIKTNYIQPNGGVSLTKANNLIIEYLRKSGTQGDIKSAAKIQEITSSEIWNNNKIQLFNFDVDYACIYSVAIIKEDVVLSVLSGMPTDSVFIADLDDDKIYEIYTNVCFGSGIVSEHILGYNPKTKEEYLLDDRSKGISYIIFLKNEKLYAKTQRVSGLLSENFKATSGELVLTNKDGKTVLEMKK